MDNLWLALSWGSPIGLAFFLVGLGAMIFLLTKADEKMLEEQEANPEHETLLFLLLVQPFFLGKCLRVLTFFISLGQEEDHGP